MFPSRQQAQRMPQNSSSPFQHNLTPIQGVTKQQNSQQRQQYITDYNSRYYEQDTDNIYEQIQEDSAPYDQRMNYQDERDKNSYLEHTFSEDSHAADDNILSNLNGEEEQQFIQENNIPYFRGQSHLNSNQTNRSIKEEQPRFGMKNNNNHYQSNENTQFKERNQPPPSHLNKNIAKKRLAIITLEVGEGKEDVIEVCEGDHLQHLAWQFCQKNCLDEQCVSYIVKNIEIQLEERMKKKKQGMMGRGENHNTPSQHENKPNNFLKASENQVSVNTSIRNQSESPKFPSVTTPSLSEQFENKMNQHKENKKRPQQPSFGSHQFFEQPPSPLKKEFDQISEEDSQEQSGSGLNGFLPEEKQQFIQKPKRIESNGSNQQYFSSIDGQQVFGKSNTISQPFYQDNYFGEEQDGKEYFDDTDFHGSYENNHSVITEDNNNTNNSDFELDQQMIPSSSKQSLHSNYTSTATEFQRKQIMEQISKNLNLQHKKAGSCETTKSKQNASYIMEQGQRANQIQEQPAEGNNSQFIQNDCKYETIQRRPNHQNEKYHSINRVNKESAAQTSYEQWEKMLEQKITSAQQRSSIKKESPSKQSTQRLNKQQTRNSQARNGNSSINNELQTSQLIESTSQRSLTNNKSVQQLRPSSKEKQKQQYSLQSPQMQQREASSSNTRLQVSPNNKSLNKENLYEGKMMPYQNQIHKEELNQYLTSRIKSKGNEAKGQFQCNPIPKQGQREMTPSKPQMIIGQTKISPSPNKDILLIDLSRPKLSQQPIRNSQNNQKCVAQKVSNFQTQNNSNLNCSSSHNNSSFISQNSTHQTLSSTPNNNSKQANFSKNMILTPNSKLRTLAEYESCSSPFSQRGGTSPLREIQNTFQNKGQTGRQDSRDKYGKVNEVFKEGYQTITTPRRELQINKSRNMNNQITDFGDQQQGNIIHSKLIQDRDRYSKSPSQLQRQQQSLSNHQQANVNVSPNNKKYPSRSFQNPNQIQQYLLQQQYQQQQQKGFQNVKNGDNENVLVKKLGKLFEEFDSDGDGLINASCIDISRTDPHLLSIIQYVLYEIDDKNLNLNKDQFIRFLFSNNLKDPLSQYYQVTTRDSNSSKYQQEFLHQQHYNSSQPFYNPNGFEQQREFECQPSSDKYPQRSPAMAKVNQKGSMRNLRQQN